MQSYPHPVSLKRQSVSFGNRRWPWASHGIRTRWAQSAWICLCIVRYRASCCRNVSRPSASIVKSKEALTAWCSNASNRTWLCHSSPCRYARTTGDTKLFWRSAHPPLPSPSSYPPLVLAL
jgi:hypothetical protein